MSKTKFAVIAIILLFLAFLTFLNVTGVFVEANNLETHTIILGSVLSLVSIICLIKALK